MPTIDSDRALAAALNRIQERLDRIEKHLNIPYVEPNPSPRYVLRMELVEASPGAGERRLFQGIHTASPADSKNTFVASAQDHLRQLMEKAL